MHALVVQQAALEAAEAQQADLRLQHVHALVVQQAVLEAVEAQRADLRLAGQLPFSSPGR